jgi:AraC-like DNA-binding protein
MHLAARALHKSSRSISSIAFNLGYDSESAFSNAFKRIMGCSPKTFRLHQQPAPGARGFALRKAAPVLHPESGEHVQSRDEELAAAQ